MFSLTTYAPETMLETSARNMAARQLYTQRIFRGAVPRPPSSLAGLRVVQPITPTCMTCPAVIKEDEFKTSGDKEEYVLYGMCMKCQSGELDDYDEELAYYYYCD